MFKNNLINDIYETRYIASWLRAGGRLYYLNDFADFRMWLESEGLNEMEADHIVQLAMCGKLELENSVKKFLSERH